MPVLFAITLFVSAALLFCVQPLIAKLLLPRLGGTPAVWNTCRVFLQIALLAGYAYAHAATTWLGVRRQALVHAVLLFLPLAVLPLALPLWALESLPSTSSPIAWLLGALLTMVGLPFFVVATSGPLLQKWFADTGHPSGGDPYFLYAASNLGSMLGLIGYPLAFEPLLTLTQQGWLWAAGYGLLVVLTLLCALALWRSPGPWFPLPNRRARTAPGEALPGGPHAALPRFRWVALAFVPSSLMLGLTTYLTTDIAAIPLLWAIPLALYLLTFILTFARHTLVPHTLMVQALPILVLLLMLMLLANVLNPVWLLLAVHLATFFAAAMVCHGELAQERPAPRHLTEFYLWLSVGGALGGLFNALVAPVLFNPAAVGDWLARIGLPSSWAAPLAYHPVAEYPLALVLVCLLRPSLGPQERTWRSRLLDWALPLGIGGLTVGLFLGVQPLGLQAGPLRTALLFGLPAVFCFVLMERPVRFALGVGVVMLVSIQFTGASQRTLYVERNFFGVVRVTEDHEGRYRRFIHGNTVHGQQNLDPARRFEAMAYYHRTGPIGHIFRVFDKKMNPPHVGITGLGAGGMACYAQPYQKWTYYEIDPAVERVARDPSLFTFLHDCPAQTVEVVLGDARLRLCEAPAQTYSLFFLDAFSSDSVPVHLITREALALYLDKLAPGGILVFNVSNRYLNLKPVLGALAQDAELVCRARDDYPASDEEAKEWEEIGKCASMWVVMARQEADLGSLGNDPRWRRVEGPLPPVWTDDYSNILAAFMWR